MANAPRDENKVTVLMGVSSADGETLLPIQVDPSTGAVLADLSTGGGSGDVSKVGTPANNQIGVWTGDGTIEGTNDLTYDGSNLQLTGDIGSTGTRITKGWFTDLQVTNAIAGDITGNSATVTTITGLAPDTATTQATQPNITTMAGLVSIQGHTVTLTGDLIRSGAHSLTLTTTGATNVTLPTSGTLVNSAVTALSSLGTVSTALTGVLRADSGVLSVDTDVTDLVTTATSSAAGKVELAIASEVTTGTDTSRAITPDALAGSDFGIRLVQAQIVEGATDVATGDGTGNFRFFVPAELNGYNLVVAHAAVVTAGTTGTTDIQIHNVTDTADMLSTKITIDTGEKTSYTAATAPVINSATDDVATGDEIRIDVDAVSTTAPKGLTIILGFQLP